MNDVDLFSSDPRDCDFHSVGWVDIGRGVEVAGLPLWDARHDLFARLSPRSAPKRLAAMGARLPTPVEVETHRKHAVFIEPYPMSGRADFEVHMRSLAWCREHDGVQCRRLIAAAGAIVPAQLAKYWTAGGGIFGAFKRPLPSRAAIQGYRQDGTVSMAHANSDHTDYMTLTLAARDVTNTLPTQPTQEPPPMPPATTAPAPTKLGDKGDAVRAWQRYLIIHNVRDDAGAQLKVDGDHGPKTEQATARWRTKMSESEPAMVTGVDVSSWQPPGRLDDVMLGKDHKFLIARATYGTHPDKAFQQHVREARVAGLIVGAYHFFRQSQPLDEQMRAFQAALTEASWGKGDLVPALDLETNEPHGDGKPKAAVFNGGCAVFAEAMKQRYGGCLVYLAPYFFLELGSPAWVLEHHVWIADWREGATAPPHWSSRPWDIWQVSATHKHKAFPLGPLDLNRARRLPLVS